MKGSFTDRVRACFRRVPDKEVTNEEIAVELDLFGRTRKPLCKVLDDLIQSGEIVRVGPGVHKWANRPRPAQLREVMWRLIRARRVVTVDDLVELSGAGEEYAREYLRLLVRRGIMRKCAPSPRPLPGREGSLAGAGSYNRGEGKGTKYQLINGEGIEAPQDTGKAEKLRVIRKKKAEALAALDRAYMAITEARMAITEVADAES